MKILTELFSDLEQPKIPMIFAEDPVVLACAAHRLGNFPDLAEITPTTEDRELGAKVRRHFMDKLVMQRLRNDKVSAFRDKLGAFLVDNRPLYNDEIGMLYRLPDFYFEDLETQELIDSTSAVAVQDPQNQTVTLKPHKCISLKRRAGAIQQYWWLDEHQRPYCLSIRESADNQPLYQSIWQFASITVEAHLFVRPFMGTNRFHYRLVGTKLLGVNNTQ